jgi:radical SAM protein with 4Fe4S-binding SPASM domain
MTRGLGYIEVELYKRVIQQAKDSTSAVFLHHFGESLLHPKLGELIRYAKNNNIKTYLSANAIMLNENRFCELVEGGLYELILSLDGVTDETSRAVRGEASKNVKLAEEKIMSLLKYRRNSSSKTPRIYMQIVRQRKNAHEVEEWFKKWSNVPGVDRAKVKSYVIWDGRDDQINDLRMDEDFQRGAIVCDKPWTSVVVLWDGRVVPCCFDYDGIYTLGNLYEQSIIEMWNGEKIKYLRQCHSEGKLQEVMLCEKCVDMEGYRIKKWYYPLNRWFTKRNRLGDEWYPEKD